MALLEIEKLTKAYGVTTALEDVDFAAEAGSVRALIGENGAGKSTMMKVLSGAVQPTAGIIRFDGKVCRFSNPHAAQEAGIATVHQELCLCPDLSVLDNIFLGQTMRNRLGFVDWASMRRKAEAVLATLEIEIPLDMPLGRLSKAKAHFVQIARSLMDQPRVLILDEPTAALTDHDSELLFRFVRRLKEAGTAIVYISHRLDEISEIADDVTVLRNGRKTGEARVADIDQAWMIRNMVGKAAQTLYERTQIPLGDCLLSLSRLSSPQAFQDIDLDIRAGEIVGLAGLVGAGRSEIAEAILGLRPSTGDIRLRDRTLSGTPAERIASGIALVPEDRGTQGLLLDFSVNDNIALPILDKVSDHGIVNTERIAEIARKYIDAFSLRPRDPRLSASSFSGGNQQKILLGKWLATQPSVLILDEPTRGVDVGAKADIHRLVDQLASEGLGILLISSDLPELLGMSDRIVVLYQGRITGEFPRGTDGDSVLHAASGFTREKQA